MAPDMVRKAAFKPGQRVLAISDIHGCKALLERLLQKLDYRPGTDALVLAGDLLTKGEENMAMLEFAMELAALPDVHILLGNCDGMNDEAEAPGCPSFWTASQGSCSGSSARNRALAAARHWRMPTAPFRPFAGPIRSRRLFWPGCPGFWKASSTISPTPPWMPLCRRINRTRWM